MECGKKKFDSHSKRLFYCHVSLSVLFEIYFIDVYLVRSGTVSKYQFLRVQDIDTY